MIKLHSDEIKFRWLRMKEQLIEKSRFESPVKILSSPPKIAIGTDFFKDLLLSSDIIVDKSMFIKEAIEDSAYAILITRPRRWGKSLNMDMLKTFLGIEVDAHGDLLPEENRVNPSFFKGGTLTMA